MFQPSLVVPDSKAIIDRIEHHRRDVATRQQHWSCAEIAARLESNYIYVPDYQRPFVWSETMQSRFIESLLLRLPIPYVFYSEMDDGRLEIVDGSQRLRTVHAFLRNKLRLSNLEKVPELNGLLFLDLPDSERNKLQNLNIAGFEFTVHFDESTRFDIFRRINSFVVQLTDAQNRAGGLKGPFYDVVLECAEDPRFVRMCPMDGRKDPTGDRAERIVRFFCYSERYLDFKHEVREFLDIFVREKNAQSTFSADHYRDRFDTMISYVQDMFPFGFCRSRTSNEVPRVRFEAISVGVYLALESGRLTPVPSFDWLESPEFALHCRTDASNSSTRLRGRVEYVRDQLTF